MKKIITLIFFLLFTTACFSATVTLQWDLSVDDPILGPNGGYRLYQTKTPGSNYTAKTTVIPGVSTVTIVPGTLGNTCWVLTAFDSSGVESDFSNEVCAVIKPGTPANLKIK